MNGAGRRIITFLYLRGSRQILYLYIDRCSLLFYVIILVLFVSRRITTSIISRHKVEETCSN